MLAGAPIEERRELVSAYVKKREADPSTQRARIGLSSPLFNRIIAGAGFEPADTPSNSGENRRSEAVCTKCGGCVNQCATVNSDRGLAEVMSAWPDLPQAVRAGIVAMVQAARSDTTNPTPPREREETP